MKYVLRYRITIPDHKGISDFMDMFRYTDDWIEKVKTRKVYIMRHFLQHRQRGTQFWHSQIKVRWRSFGAEVELLGEAYATLTDKTHRYEKGVVPIIKGNAPSYTQRGTATKYDIDNLRAELTEALVKSSKEDRDKTSSRAV